MELLFNWFLCLFFFTLFNANSFLKKKIFFFFFIELLWLLIMVMGFLSYTIFKEFMYIYNFFIIIICTANEIVLFSITILNKND